MPRLVEMTVPALRLPSLTWREAARESDCPHAVLAADPEAVSLQAVRLATGSARGADLPLVVAAWNVERGRDVAEIAARLDEAGVAVALLSELDIGMARSGNRDTSAEIAERLGADEAFAVEFIELGLGDARETAEVAGKVNAAGLHGNAVVSRLPIRRAWAIRLDEGGRWFADVPDPAQRRIGGRVAVAAELEAPFGPLFVASVHLESHSDADGRAAEFAALFDALDPLVGDAPLVVGGDINTACLTAGVIAREGPAAVAREPLFAVAERNGLLWTTANTFASTTRRRAWHTGSAEPKSIDWLFVRGLQAGRASVRPAVDATGEAISDHEMILAEFAP